MKGGIPAFGGGPADSVFSPLALVITLIAGILICVLRRDRAIVPFFLAAILIPYDQVLVIGTLHFQMVRILAVFGLLRVAAGKVIKGDKIFSGGMNGIDKAWIVMVTFGAIDGVLLWREWGEVVFQAGALCTVSGAYLLLRHLVRDEDDIKRLLRVWACIAVVVAAVMIGEQLTGRNAVTMFLGGVHAAAHETVTVRGGSARATGVFDHPILAGTFGGISVPLFVGLWWKEKKKRGYAAIGITAGALIPFLASSSTALMGLIAGLIALACWGLRRQMRAVRWAFIGLIVAYELRLKSHFWHLIADVDFTGSSSSWHRFMLVDQCVRHFWDWALIGTKDFPNWGWEMLDLSNQYVATADTSGLIPLISFVAIVVFGFKYLGRARRAADSAGDRRQELFIWAVSASLFANMIAFIGISYFDQTMVAWCALLAVISAVTLSAREMERADRAVSFANPGFKVHPSLASSPAGINRSKQSLKARVQSRQ